ncbi:hypothetical protein [Chryseobacterium indologenes]|uniref:hypothetical protein n=1 Tax=Chryseobacterium indologenes TaxID=253 RepID=UPI003D34C587
MENILKQIQELCNGIEYSRHVPYEAEKLAKENGVVIIVGGSDDLMYCYGANCYLTDEVEHGVGWDGEDLTVYEHDSNLQSESYQLGLKIWWEGVCNGEKKENYSIEESGAFSYSVKEGIEYLEFKVVEDLKDPTDIYCTGIIIKLPEYFTPANY